MAHPNPNLDRTNKPQSFKTRVAANLNFEKRCLMGFVAQAHIHSNLAWIRQNPEYLTALTSEQRSHLSKIHQTAVNAREAARLAIVEIEKYYLLPSVEQPKRTRQRASKAIKTGQGAAENS